MIKRSLVFDLTEDQVNRLRKDLGLVDQDEAKSLQPTIKYINTEEAMEKYRVGRKTISRWIDEGLPYIKSRPNVFLESDIEKFVQGKMIRRK